MRGGGGGGRGMGLGPHSSGRRGTDTEKGEQEPPKLRLTDRRMLQWFADNLGDRWPTLVIAVVAMVVAAAADMAQPMLIRYLIDDGLIGRNMGMLGYIMLLMLATFFASALFTAIRMNLMHVLGQKFVYEMRVRAYRHLQKLSLNFFHRNKTGDLMSRLSNDVNSVEDMVVHGTDEVISDVLRVLFTVGAIFWMSWKLALLSLAPLPIFITAILLFSRYIRPIYRQIRDELGEINAQLEERIAGVLVIKAFGREAHEFGNFDRTSKAYYDANVRAIRLWSSFSPALGFLTSLGMLLVMWRGGMMIGTGMKEVTPGIIMGFVGYLQQFYWRFGGLIRVWDLYNRALAALARIFQVTDEVPEIADKPDAIELKACEGHVDLAGVTFKYATGDIVLRDVSVHADPGDTVALVGRSGAGKTSLINLIPRFYDPLEGTVKVDGHDVRDLAQVSLRRHIAMVLQETFLFNGTVKDNVRYGRLEATDEEIEAACKAAYADEFIQDLPDRYDTEIGERGVKLSGGQKQRLAIARALLANPKILILDEATSLVDTEAEQIIQAALENLMRGRTTFVIAHRLSTVRNADKIVVIDEGEVKEEADHDTLMQQRGLYAGMIERQFRMAEEYGMGGGLIGGPG
jgi:ATP-binding cassette, subfamily B, bacterial MsbA